MGWWWAKNQNVETAVQLRASFGRACGGSGEPALVGLCGGSTEEQELEDERYIL